MCRQLRLTLTAKIVHNCNVHVNQQNLQQQFRNVVLYLEINGNTNLAKRPHTQSCYYICQDCLVHLGDIGKPIFKCTLLFIVLLLYIVLTISVFSLAKSLYSFFFWKSHHAIYINRLADTVTNQSVGCVHMIYSLFSRNLSVLFGKYYKLCCM